MLADDASAPVVLRALLETLYRALGLHRVALCLPDTREPGWLVGRLGLGPGVEHWLRTLRVPLQPLPTDLFSLVCAKGVDTLLDDTRTEDVARRLPAGYVQHIGAPTLLLLPLVRQGRGPETGPALTRSGGRAQGQRLGNATARNARLGDRKVPPRPHVLVQTQAVHVVVDRLLQPDAQRVMVPVGSMKSTSLRANVDGGIGCRMTP